MKKQITTILLTLIAVAGQAQIHYRLEGTIGDSTLNTKLLLCQQMAATKMANAPIDTLEVVDGKLIQNPVEGIEGLRDEKLDGDGTLPSFCELIAEVPDGDSDFNLFTKADGSGGMTMHYDAAQKTVRVDRRGMDKRFNEQVGEVLEVPLTDPLKNIRVLIDRCSVEIFFNDGQATFTSHIYPTDTEHSYTITEGGKVTVYTLKPSVVDNFVV